VIIDEHIEDVLAVLNLCVAFSVQPAGVRFLQSQVVCILASHWGSSRLLQRTRIQKLEFYTCINIKFKSVQRIEDYGDDDQVGIIVEHVTAGCSSLSESAYLRRHSLLAKIHRLPQV
jgi:hypothetical protein